MVLDAANLDAILQEARSCFLYEDAPDYLEILEQGVQRLLVATSKPGKSSNDSTLGGEYATLMRAAHSLKGGAGIAQLPSIQKISHKLEDLLQALHERQLPVQQTHTAYELLSLGVGQVKDLIAETLSYQDSVVTTDSEAANSLPIVVALDRFLQDLPQPTPNLDNSLEGSSQASAINPFILKSALELDLEECLQRVEALLGQPVRPAALKQGLTNLIEECNLLGQTLNLTWLVESGDTVRKALTPTNPPLENIAKTAISQMRQLRTQTLQGGQGNAQKRNQESKVVEAVGKQTTELNPPPNKPEDKAPAAQVTPTLNLRIPVTRLDRMNNILGELLIGYERLSLHQSHLYQANSALKKQAQQLNPINEQVQVFYDQLATSVASPLVAATTDSLALRSANSEFDPLQFDRYTAFHTTLQNFQELMVRVQEIRSDIDLITRDFQEGLDQLRQQLDNLRSDLTQSRLVPFRFLAERFVTPLQTLCQKYHKPVQLTIVGQETLVDQVILEQLQTPLTHLIRNAFDHGIETPRERLALGKPETAQITLTASIQGNQVVIAIADDGSGIDTQKVERRAVQMGLCSSDTVLTKEQILEFLFMAGFSTASAVTDLSGRGVGLDVVRLQVERLRGFISVETKWQQGTKFTITIPLTLSILPLLLCRCQQRTLAIPSNDILEIIALAEFCDDSSSSGTIIWQNRQVPLFSLTQLLPYTRPESILSSWQHNQKLGIVLNVASKLIVVAVDALLGEKELVLKPFDLTVKVPAYVAGCTVLGTGEVVPILSPIHFDQLITQMQQTLPLQPGLPKDGSDVDAKEVPTILIVDDSIGVRRMLDRILNQSGYQVVQCRDGKEALETLNRSSELYDLVISDIEMPHMDGFALLREIRSNARWHNLPVAMLTSRENDQHRQKAKQLGATAYFTKPFHPNKFLSAIAALLA